MLRIGFRRFAGSRRLLPGSFFGRALIQDIRHASITRCPYSIDAVVSPHDSPASCNYGICLDIDGVLVKGQYVLPEATQALRFLRGENPLNKKIPFIFLTNGGGVTEVKKAMELSKRFEVPISLEQLVLSHSPMRALVNAYADALVLVIGGVGESCREVAESYGFKRVAIPTDILAWRPNIWPFKRLNEDLCETRQIDFSKEPIEAVMMFHDSFDWGRDLQIMLDVLRSSGGYIGTLAGEHELMSCQLPLFLSNPDLIWSTDFPVPRFAQGSFASALKLLFRQETGHALKYMRFGKPETPTYCYAEQLLEKYAECLLGKQGSCRSRRRIYAVGDNPAADIAGANARDWTSILVRTGVFQGLENDITNPADHVAQNVMEAVKWVFQQEEQY